MSILKKLFISSIVLGVATIANADIGKPINLFKTNSSQSVQKQKININQADIKELSKIKGLNTKKAKMIVEHREIYGNFKSLSDLTKVKGIGTKLLKKIEENVTV